METRQFPKDQQEPISALLPTEVTAQCPRIQREGTQFRAAATELMFETGQVFLVGCEQLGADGRQCTELSRDCPVLNQCGQFRDQLVQVCVDWFHSFD